MNHLLRISCEGRTEFIATDRSAQPLKVMVECPQGLAAGTDGKHREALSKGIYWTQYDWSVANERARRVAREARRLGRGIGGH